MNPAPRAAPIPAAAGARRRAAPWALAWAVLALPGVAQAQFAGSLGVDNVDRYRGTGTAAAGPVVRASAMADSSWGAYGGVSGLWRTRDGGLASADALAGWSAHLDALPGLASLAPGWGLDAALHRTHYARSGRDFSEAMLGLLGPDWALRTWYAPHYFGGDMHASYTELNASHAFDPRWHAFGHVGWLHYGSGAYHEARIPDRTDTQLGIGATLSNCEFHLARDGLVGGRARGDMDARSRRAAWILGASVAF